MSALFEEWYGPVHEYEDFHYPYSDNLYPKYLKIDTTFDSQNKLKLNYKIDNPSWKDGINDIRTPNVPYVNPQVGFVTHGIRNITSKELYCKVRTNDRRPNGIFIGAGGSWRTWYTSEGYYFPLQAQQFIYRRCAVQIVDRVNGERFFTTAALRNTDSYSYSKAQRFFITNPTSFSVFDTLPRTWIGPFYDNVALDGLKWPDKLRVAKIGSEYKLYTREKSQSGTFDNIFFRNDANIPPNSSQEVNYLLYPEDILVLNYTPANERTPYFLDGYFRDEFFGDVTIISRTYRESMGFGNPIIKAASKSVVKKISQLTVKAKVAINGTLKENVESRGGSEVLGDAGVQFIFANPMSR